MKTAYLLGSSQRVLAPLPRQIELDKRAKQPFDVDTVSKVVVCRFEHHPALEVALTDIGEV
jgi:hypothetical protein